MKALARKTLPILASLFLMAPGPLAHRRNPLPAFRYDFAPSTGELKLLVILMRFPEDQPQIESARFEDILFSTGKLPGGSVSEYFYEVSYGRLKVSGEVRGWYTAAHQHSFYAGGAHGHNAGFYPKHMSRLVEEAVERAKEDGADLSKYDNSGDGHVDGLIVIHSGRGGDTSGDRDHIWTKMHYLSMGGTEPFEEAGKIIDRYGMIQEIRRPGVEVPVGFICHELGHMMGLPDLGDKTRKSAGIGRFGLMGSGFWGDDDPARPFHLCAWSKVKLRWIEPEVIEENSIVKIPQAETNPVAFRIDTSLPDEYFLVENRQKAGYDEALPGGGVLIWHIDESVLTENSYSCIGLCPDHYIVALEQADGKNDLEKNNNSGDAHDFFKPGPASISRWAADTGTEEYFMAGAHSMDYSGGFSGLSVEIISQDADVITARIKTDDRSHPSPGSPLVFIADYYIRFRDSGKSAARERKGEYELHVKAANIGAPAKRLRVTAQASGIWFSRARAGLERLDTGRHAWLDRPFVYRITGDFEPGRKVGFKFLLTSRPGRYSTTITRPMPAGRPGILLLDDSRRGMESFYGRRLDELKETFFSHDVSERGLPSPDDLSMFQTVIWAAPLQGNIDGRLFDRNRRELISSYLAVGGNLLLVAPHLDLKGDEFWNDILKIKSARPEAGMAGVKGISGDVISRGHYAMTGSLYYPRITPHSSLDPSPDAAAIYTDLHGHVAGVRYPIEKEAGHKIVILSFPLEAIGPAMQRQILGRTIGFFRMPVGAPIADMLQPRSIPVAAGEVKVTVTGINFDPGIKAGFDEKGILVKSVSFSSPERLEMVIEVSRSAGTGPLTLTLTNPGIDGQKFPEAIAITEKPESEK